MKAALWIASAIVALGGCATATEYPATPAYNRYTLEQVVEWSKAGESAERIIARLEAARALYPMTASDIVRLEKEGVPVPVLNYILDTYVMRVRREERFQMPSRFEGH
jgi:hypothetical protein